MTNLIRTTLCSTALILCSAAQPVHALTPEIFFGPCRRCCWMMTAYAGGNSRDGRASLAGCRLGL